MYERRTVFDIAESETDTLESIQEINAPLGDCLSPQLFVSVCAILNSGRVVESGSLSVNSSVAPVLQRKHQLQLYFRRSVGQDYVVVALNPLIILFIHLWYIYVFENIHVYQKMSSKLFPSAPMFALCP